MSVRLPTIGLCETAIFGLAEGAHTRSFLSDARGVQHLASLLRLAGETHDDTLAAAAYLFCAIINQRPFARYNEALAVTLLTSTMLLNNYVIAAHSLEAIREQMQWLFPKLQWNEARTFAAPHEAFLYHLARVMADPNQKGPLTLAQEQAAVRHLLPLIAKKAA